MIKLDANPKQIRDHLNEIVPVLQARIDHVLSTGYILKGTPRNQIRVTSKMSRFLLNLLSNGVLHSYLKESVENIEGRIEDVIENWPEITTRGTEDYEIAKNIFFHFGYDKINKFDFIKGFNLNTCPYCNRNYIFALRKNKLVKPEIDHFYPKSRYPFLAVSFYNLIPSCPVCNGLGGKSSTDPFIVGLKSPYEIEDSDFKFSHTLLSWQDTDTFRKTSIDLMFSKKVQVNSDLFKLEDLYQSHADHVEELVVKSKKEYSPKFRAFLKEFDINYSDKELDRMILGNYTEVDEQGKRPLAKLYQDIGQELGLI